MTHTVSVVPNFLKIGLWRSSRYNVLIGYWTNTVFWDRVLWSEFDHRACEVINPTKERGPRTLYEFNNRIIIYLYKIINFIKYHQIYVGLLIIIKCFEHQFIPKHRIRIDIAFKESFSSNQETGKVFSLEMPFYSNIFFLKYVVPVVPVGKCKLQTICVSLLWGIQPR